MRVFSAPPDYAFDHMADDIVNVALLGRAEHREIGYIGDRIQRELTRRRLQPVTRAHDLLLIALSVIAADLACERRSSPDGWTRELDVTVAVREPDFWSEQKSLVEQQLRFLTTDIWNVSFTGGSSPEADSNPPEAPDDECVLLLSGGLDSMIGALDVVAAGKRPYAVSQMVKGDRLKQVSFASTIGGGLQHIQFSTNPKLTVQERPPAQRARSFLFLAYGAVVASALKRYNEGDRVDLYVCENGFISINPPLTEMRLGSLSTRTTHPFYIKLYQELLDACGLRVNIVTPYQHKTKGEMLALCQDQQYLLERAHESTSCGRFGRYGYTHCGRCVPCLIRRAGFQRWGVEDRTIYRYRNLADARSNRGSFDDVWSAVQAVTQVEQEGLDRWLGCSLTQTLVGDTAPFRNTLQRGLGELGSFLREQRVL